MNLHQDFNIVKQMLKKQRWMFNFVLSTFVSLSYSPDEGLLKPKRVNVDFPS